MFIPLHDHNPLRHVLRPYVTWGLILTNVFAYVVLQGAGVGEVYEASAYSYGLIPSVLFDLRDLSPELMAVPENATLVTYAFLHADFWHLAGNMLFLWVFGDNVEDAMGHVKYLAFYLLSAAAGGLAYALLSPGSDVPLVGASGAVSGIVAAYVMLHPRVRVWVLVLGRIPLPIPALWALGAWIALQFFNLVTDSDGQVAWSAHVGGIVAGAVLVMVLRRRGVRLFDRGLTTGTR
ncbi:rhomboid family intramembrane serine protease [Microvirga tunisiensis]|uniref:Rhomboid family intramembrane serine protease n=1 Tax=Pannonibacter tanglangensis TaxID=2750084 RepID=A0A7X5F5N4_9HYPH|nr:rhomboid family intramembrane serine protease [Pannonibacter sp. XCT-53]NBN80223.1 rhomboid family intramembrane serine protease [Pannonibacter sp. XCT-53]